MSKESKYLRYFSRFKFSFCTDSHLVFCHWLHTGKSQFRIYHLTAWLRALETTRCFTSPQAPHRLSGFLFLTQFSLGTAEKHATFKAFLVELSILVHTARGHFHKTTESKQGDRCGRSDSFVQIQFCFFSNPNNAAFLDWSFHLLSEAKTETWTLHRLYNSFWEINRFRVPVL